MKIRTICTNLEKYSTSLTVKRNQLEDKITKYDKGSDIYHELNSELQYVNGQLFELHFILDMVWQVISSEGEY